MSSSTVKEAIVRIYYNHQPDFAGAGFLVGERYVLTCAHVILSALNLQTRPVDPPDSPISLDFPLISPGTQLAARVCFWSADKDIAGLELLDTPPAGSRPLSLSSIDNSNESLWGIRFRAFGFPYLRNDGVDAQGEFRGRNARNWIMIEGLSETGYRVEQGFSGAPVWSETIPGILGMIVASETDQNVKAAYIIPSDVILAEWALLHAQAYIRRKSHESLFRHACYISYHHAQAYLIEPIIAKIEHIFSGELSMWRSETIFVDKKRLRSQLNETDYSTLATNLCHSACMLAVMTPIYFNPTHTYCTREFIAMERLERKRLATLGKPQNLTSGLIIPILLKDYVPKIIEERDHYSFGNNAFLLPDDAILTHDKYYPQIEQIAKYISNCCEIFEDNSELFDPCENYNLPTEIEALEFLDRINSSGNRSHLPFPGRNR